LLDDLGADPEVTRALFDGPGPLDTNMAVRLLAAGTRRLIVVDDVDAGGHEAADLLALVAARLVTCSIAVVATAAASLGVGRDLKLCGLPRPEAGRASADRLALGWYGPPNPLDRIGRGCADALSLRLPGAQIRGVPGCRMTMVNGEV